VPPVWLDRSCGDHRESTLARKRKQVRGAAACRSSVQRSGPAANT
jgi:hypothetical protein